MQWIVQANEPAPLAELLALVVLRGAPHASFGLRFALLLVMLRAISALRLVAIARVL